VAKTAMEYEYFTKIEDAQAKLRFIKNKLLIGQKKKF
jgi:hypothetical protein